MMIKLCKTGAAYEIIPERRVKMNLSAAAKDFQDNGYSVVVSLPDILIVKNDYEITAYPSGRMLIKTDDEVAARCAADSAYKILGLYD